MEGSTFKSTNTKKIYKIRQKVDCQSAYIIYLGTCQKCQGQYVGKSTQPFTRRHSGQKQEIKNQIGGLGQHYGGARGCGYDNLKIVIIEKVEFGNSGLLGQREIYWQNQLRCFMENGGKAHCKRKRSESYSGIEIVFQFSIEVSTFSFESPASTIVDNGK